MRGEYTLTDVVLLYIDWDLGGEYMSEAKKNGLSANFVDVSSLSLFSPFNPHGYGLFRHPPTCTHMCPQCPHLRKIVYNFSSISYNGVTFSLFFGPFSSIFVDIRLRLGPSPPVLTVLTCPHPPHFPKYILLRSILPHFFLLAKFLALACPPMWACPSRASPIFLTIYYLSYTLPLFSISVKPPQMWITPFAVLPPSNPSPHLQNSFSDAPEHPIFHSKVPITTPTPSNSIYAILAPTPPPSVVLQAYFFILFIPNT